MKAEQALRIVNDLALWQRVELILLRVMEREVVPMPAYLGGMAVNADIATKAHKNHTEEYITGVEGRERALIKEVKSIVGDGDPAEVIVRTAEQENVDLIVMVTHGYGLFERLMIGSVTEKVVRFAPCPVFAIRDEHLPENILVALDGTPYSEEILPLVYELANFFDAKVTLTTVRRLKDIPTMNDLGDLPHLDRALAENLLSIEAGRPGQYLDALRRRALKDYDIEVDFEVEVGDPGREIVKVAERKECDVIAMVTHGRVGMDWLTKGSVTERVMHNTDTAMLILHKEENE
jgi:nucleotide-binding universal stress UspA family protein